MEGAVKPPEAPGSQQEVDPGEESLLSALPPPPPFAVVVTDLCIDAPVPQWTVPLAIPITVPRWLQARLQKGEGAVPKALVRDVSVDIVPGEVLAIIGGSGSGKTTFLNTLAGRMGNLELPSGTIDYRPLGSQAAASSDPRKHIGYVRQDDALLPYLTRTAIVDQTLLELGLRDVADVLVGGALRRGISGGERRRLSIACTLVTMPSILVLDEPTSGLDSSTAFQILKTLRKLAARGRVVVLSCHLPRSEAFALFDKILLFSRGSPVFSGRRDEMLPHFASLGFPLPEHTNPLDFVIDISSIDSRSEKVEEATKDQVGKLVLAWREAELRRTNAPSSHPSSIHRRASSAGSKPPLDLEKADAATPTAGTSTRAFESPAARANVLQQTILLTHRGLRNVTRNWGVLAGFALQAIIIGVVLGLVFFDPPETPAGIVSLKTLAYMNGPAFFYLSIILAIFLLCQELVVFDREREDNLYTTVPWVVSTILSYGPVNVICPTLYCVIVYFMAGFWREHLARNILSFIAHGILQQQASWSYALIACAINRSFAQASLLANGFSIMFFLSAGYLIPDLPVWVDWTKWLSQFYYGFHWIARLQFVGRTFACEGVTGPALNQCEGVNVLRGMRFNLNTPLYVYPLGLLGFVLVTYSIGLLILANFHPGGVKHAAQQASTARHAETVSHDQLKRGSSRRSVDVVVSRLRLVVSKRSWLSRQQRQDKVILEDVSASFPAGQVSAIMGPSGAGKSSLLQVLAGRLSSSAMSAFSSTGAITLNGKPFDASLASLVAFVEQEDDHHLPALTVRETFRYAAKLSLKDQSTPACYARAEEIIRMLGLAPCADNLIGGPLLKGISGGEKRRVSLGVQLIAGAAVLYADEPLTGLDAFTAQSVMQTLSDLAAAGHTVVITAHQPRKEIWSAFDQILLLAKGGRTVYSGSTSSLFTFLESAGEVCPPNFNPADFVLDAISPDYSTAAAEQSSSLRIERLVAAWRTARQQDIEVETKDSPSSMPSARPRSTAFFKAFPVVLSRSFTNLRRQPDIFIARIANPPFLACLFWLFFARLDYGPSSPQTRIGLLQETTALPFVGMLSCIAIFPFEKALFVHEYKTSARHSVLTFLTAYTVSETCTSLLSSLPWAIIFIYGMNLQQSGRIFVEFWISSFALISVGESIGIAFSSWTNNGGLAVSLVSAGLTLLGQVNGIISATVPYWLEVIAWISPMKPQAYLQTINEFVGLEFDCSPDELASGACIAATGEQVLDTFGLPYGDTGKYMGILMALVVIWRALAFAALYGRIKTM
ncbi:hypothetical protein Rhopal_006104-T1 [Rhodotorula paludigena]|uniref:ABC transporter domain-containing protein n=1 Tax=Rhodotorula paludigena TaxID=86838 RepID=A0AAV5GSY0_9BASI|nr:hypothetical protein Rhopal_006104-T1 [Rhodotorula paludigena]